MDPDLVRLSKRLARALRHDPGSAGLRLDPHGWVDVAELLSALRVSRVDLDAVVATNDKRRYALRLGPDGREQIRASQGHSVPVDLELMPLDPPAVLFHGTSEAALPSIRAQGLLPGKRHHVHLSPDEETAWRVGRRRRGPAVLLTVDAAAMHAAGHVFHRSANGVWLTERVPSVFLGSLPPS